MKSPSRMIQPLHPDQKMGFLGWSVVTILFIGGIILAISSVEWRWAFGGFVAFCVVLGFVSQRQQKCLEKVRRDDSICSFARKLPARDHDTWIVRAVYEGLAKDRGVGIRPEDRLGEDLLFLPEDLEELTVEIAKRAGRTMTHAEQNPLANQVATVQDLISFLEHQPRMQRA